MPTSARRTRSAAILLVLAALSAGPAGPAGAAESYDSCVGTITSLPATITTQGTWCLKSDLSTAIAGGAAITVAANNVTIDCNHFKLGGLAAGAGTQTDGILFVGRSNVVVRQCRIRGFHRGIGASDGSGHVIEDNRFDGNTWTAIEMHSTGSVIRDNLVLDTGGSSGPNLTGFGIIAGIGTDVLDNMVAGVTPAAGTGVRGILTADNQSTTVSGNRISGLQPDEGGVAVAIRAISTAEVIEDNFIYGTMADDDIGIDCSSDSTTSRRNSFIRIETATTFNCTSIGDIVNPN